MINMLELAGIWWNIKLISLFKSCESENIKETFTQNLLVAFLTSFIEYISNVNPDI